MYFIFSSCMLLALFWSRIRQRRIDLALVITNLFFGFLYVKILRTTYYWSVIYVFSSIYLLSEFPSAASAWRSRIGKAAKMAAFLLFVFIAAIEVDHAMSSSYFGFGIDYKSPVEETEFIRKNLSSCRLGNDYDSGSYLLWALWPETKVFIDARYFPYKSWISEFKGLYGSSKEYKDRFFRKYRCDAWCIEYGFPELYTYFISSPDWRLVHYGPAACIFAAKDLKGIKDSEIAGRTLFGVNIFQALPILDFTLQIGDTATATGIAEHVKVNALIPAQKSIYLNVLNELGKYLLKNDRIKESIRILSRSRDMKPDDPRTLCYLGDAFFKDRDLPEAVHSYSEAIKLKEGMSGAHYNLGNALFLSNDISNAIAHYTRALQIDGTSSAARDNLALALQKKEQIEKTILQLQRTVASDPTDVNSLYSLSAMNSSLGRYDESLRCLFSILKLKPGNPDVYYNIACLMAKQNRVDDSVAYLRKAVQSGFDNWSLLRGDHDLDRIRNTPYYGELVKKM